MPSIVESDLVCRQMNDEIQLFEIAEDVDQETLAKQNVSPEHLHGTDPRVV